ncbi:uncharacterized protein MJAP1_001357 [Malassezia japonica]|uniref:Thioredoxin-like fold domain-containing protein n=1 Tax=Malassezia japonica TaxID=223818 RepID=A0AAF0F0C4_9BASI|nr:uncharacterized protein MJAP1_001357 [Malassezia japonica]WFD38405.1 hypothetical protein MJAP1_001357 [Malassezia japonica]
MALPPALQALAIGSVSAPNVLELYVDYLCPFSAKILNNFQSQVVPLLFGEQAPFRGKVRVIVRPVPQPWHASSSLLHETALAVARLSLTDRVALEDPEKNAFWVFSQALMKESERWYDGPARSKNPDQVRAELATLAVNVLGEDVRKAKKESIVALDGQPLGQAVRSWTRVSDEGNAGSKIVPDLKYCIKIGRQNGIHITPTALWNGVVEPSISSSFSQEEWRKFLDERVPKANI